MATSGSVRAATKRWVATSAPLDHILEPLITQSLPSRTALVRSEAASEPVLASFLHATILNHETLESALSFHLAQKLDSPAAPALLVREVIEEAFASE